MSRSRAAEVAANHTPSSEHLLRWYPNFYASSGNIVLKREAHGSVAFWLMMKRFFLSLSHMVESRDY